MRPARPPPRRVPWRPRCSRGGIRGGINTALTGCEAVIHLATRIPVGADTRFRRRWATNDTLRREATANLALALHRTDGRRPVMESISFAYVDRGDELIDESTPLAPSAVLESAYMGERLVADAVSRGDLEAGVSLRLGVLYAREAAGRPCRLGLRPVAALGQQPLRVRHGLAARGVRPGRGVVAAWSAVAAGADAPADTRG